MEKEIYENLIEFLKRTLEFYANEDNYIQRPSGNDLSSMIELDDGKQAKEAIKRVDELEKSIKSFENDYEKLIENAEMDDPTTATKKITEELNKINKWKSNIKNSEKMQ